MRCHLYLHKAFSLAAFRPGRGHYRSNLPTQPTAENQKNIKNDKPLDADKPSPEYQDKEIPIINFSV